MEKRKNKTKEGCSKEFSLVGLEVPLNKFDGLELGLTNDIKKEIFHPCDTIYIYIYMSLFGD